MGSSGRIPPPLSYVAESYTFALGTWFQALEAAGTGFVDCR